jgi:hypothetical protein
MLLGTTIVNTNCKQNDNHENQPMGTKCDAHLQQINEFHARKSTVIIAIAETKKMKKEVK